MEKGILRKRLIKCLELILSAGALLFAWRTLHDMQIADGTGLYLAIRAGSENRRLYDLLVEAVGMCGLLVLLLAPCILLRRLNTGSFFRFLASCLAFLPVLSTAALVHLLDGTDAVLLRGAVSEGRLGDALWEGVAGVAPALALGIPLLLLAAGLWKVGASKPEKPASEKAGTEKSEPERTAAEKLGPGKAEPEKAGTEEFEPERTAAEIFRPERPEPENVGTEKSEPERTATEKLRPDKAAGRKKLPAVTGVIQLLLLMLALLFPVLADVCSYMILYLFLLWAFWLWEKLYVRYPALNAWGWLLFGAFWLRGMERMLEVMSVYHI